MYEAYNPTPLYIISYKYNDHGYRTSKEIATTTTVIETIEYTLINDQVIFETNGTYAILYTYDYDGTLIGFSYDPNVNISNNEEDYFYLRNQQGDITHILNASGLTVVHYVYDAYGNITKTEVTSGYGYIANINSYTYRGYRYDSETNLYYLNSRYYNPLIGRFINSDGLLGEQGNIIATNMYAYCGNNPIMHVDPSGKSFLAILGTVVLGAAIGGYVGAITAAINGDDIGAGFCSGAVAGAIISVGIATAVALGPALGMPFAAGTGFLGGGLGDVVSQGMNKGWNKIELGHSLIVGGISAAITLGSFCTMSYIASSTPSLFGNMVNRTIPIMTRISNSLSLTATTAFLAFTYGATGSLLNSLANLLVEEKEENEENIIDIIAVCD
ncbi:MAG: RHS repeat-associated core domain-containing protein [Acholeplasmataceae bacterium]|nr:RHS repeat-associated core domain-containing protein [Acholeplasmataceae bacterium]